MSYLDNTWISATSTYNYMMKDPLLDWLKYHHGSLTHKHRSYRQVVNTCLEHSKSNYNFTSYIMEQGKIFEKKVMKLIIKKFGNDRVIEIDGQDDPRNPSKVQETVAAMKKGIPIIHSGVIHNPTNKTFGIPDLLVRSDWLKYLVDEDMVLQDINEKSPALNTSWHYRVIDIKFTGLLLRSDGINLLNSGSFPAYKAQLLIYNLGLGHLQGYTPGQVYILGRRWRYTSKGEIYTGNSCFDKLGIIDYDSKDKEYISKTNEALNWIREVKEPEAADWNILNYPLERLELYPNMCNSHDHPWHGIKKEIADQNKELTNLWMVGPKHRSKALEEGVYKWTDPNCNPDILGFKKGNISNTLEKIIKINQSNKYKILPRKIANNIYNWQNPQKIEFQVDFETVGGVISSIKKLPMARTETIIFMIGVGYKDPDTKKWIYTDFTVDQLTFEEENRICKEFANFIKEKSEEYGVVTPQCIHWSKAEDNMWNDAVERHDSDLLDSVSWDWLDLLNVFKKEPIVINGCFSYGLKDVASAMKKHGMIKSSWDKKNECSDGQSAMIAARKAWLEAKSKGVSMKQIPIIKEIIDYNEVDVKVLYEIITYLRKKHSNVGTGRTVKDAINEPVSKKRIREEEYGNNKRRRET